MKFFRFSFLFLCCVALISLSSCATLSKKDCVKGDWYRVGYKDGLNGETLGRLSKHEKACGKHEIVVNPARYQQGRQTGLLAYCTESSGYEEGYQLDYYSGVCPKNLEQNFLHGYLRGLHRLNVDQQRELDDAYDEVRSLQNKYRRTKNEEEKAALDKDIETAEAQVDAIKDKKRKTEDEINRYL